MKKSSISLLGIAILAVFLASFSHTFAYTVVNSNAGIKGDFVLEPGKIELFVNPGDKIIKNITVTSRIDGTTNFTVSSEDFVGSRIKDQPVVLLGSDKSPYSFKDNLIPDTKTFSLTGGQKAIIPVAINVPKDAMPGGYYSAVLVSSQPHPTDTGGVGTQVVTRIGVLFFIRVNGEASEAGNLDDFRIAEGNRQFGLLQNGPLTFEALFNNTGNVYLTPSGSISIKNLFGQEVASLPVDAYFSLPNSLRYRDIVWPQQLLFGRYTATITLNPGYGDQMLTKSITFWVIPWKYIGLVALAALFLTLIIYIFSRNFEFRRKG